MTGFLPILTLYATSALALVAAALAVGART